MWTARTPQCPCQVSQVETGSRQPFSVQMELEGSQEQCSEWVSFAGATPEAWSQGCQPSL